MKTITSKQLLAAGACGSQVRLFRRVFGLSAELTSTNWAKAGASGLDVMWLDALLDAPARAAYESAEAPARAAYGSARSSALFNALLSK